MTSSSALVSASTSPFSVTQMTYDGNGRVVKTEVGSGTNSDGNIIFTAVQMSTTVYDNLGRQTSTQQWIHNPGNPSAWIAYGQPTTYEYERRKGVSHEWHTNGTSRRRKLRQRFGIDKHGPALMKWRFGRRVDVRIIGVGRSGWEHKGRGVSKAASQTPDIFAAACAGIRPSWV